MSGRVTPVAFTADLLGRASVQAFDCGGEVWEREITDWLKAPPGTDGAANEAAAGNPVWLYVAGGELVGVASIGPASTSWPKNSSPRRPATCITWVAVDRLHRGQGYGGEIMNHVLGECLGRAGEFPLVVLYVHHANPARAWYTAKYNFVPLGKPLERDGRSYDRFVLSLV